MNDELPPVEFPDGLKDNTGRRLRPGSAVCLTKGPFAGQLGEVVGYGGRRGIEVLLDTDPPRLVAIAARQLTRVDRPMPTVSTGRHVVERSDARVALVVPIGAQDVQQRPGTGRLPPAAEFASWRATRHQVDARRWGEALLHTLEQAGDDADTLAATELTAPMLQRALIEAALPQRVSRLVLVVTDQDTPHVDDTAPFGNVLTYWLRGSGILDTRPVDDIAPPVVIRDAPHVLDAVIAATRTELPRILDGCNRLAIVQAGGTPAMPFGVLLAAATTGIRTRHIQVPFQAPLIEIDFPELAVVDDTGFGPRTRN